MPKITVASDYAVLRGEHCTAYYGYEYAPNDDDAENEDTWGFEFERDGVSLLRLSFRELHAQDRVCSDPFDTTDCLLTGLGLVLDRRL